MNSDRPGPYPRFVVPFMLIMAITDFVIMGLISEPITARVIGAPALPTTHWSQHGCRRPAGWRRAGTSIRAWGHLRENWTEAGSEVEGR